MNDVKIQLTMLISREPKTADQKPCTSKPGIIVDTRLSKRALITKVNNPSERRLIGSVRINNIGLKKALSMPRIAAAKNAARNPLEWMPSIR